MITVVGSINMDLTATVREIPKVGETVLGTDFFENSGGKGANQAAAAAKLGNEVVMLGAVGNDSFADSLIASLNACGVKTDYIAREDGPSGIALIQVDKVGRNNIVVIPGSNNKVTEDYVRRNISLFEQTDIVLTQLEIPIDTVEYVMSEGKKRNCITILNPAPAAELAPDIFKNIDIITPNEHELEKMTGINTESDDGCRDAAKKLLSLGAKSVIVTRGEKGIFFVSDSEEFFVAANKVQAVDTTAAGDAFLGGLVSCLDLGGSIEEAIDIGQKVAAYAIQRRGAQQSFPDKQCIYRI